MVASSCGFDAYGDYYDGAEDRWYFGRGWCQIRYMPRMSNYRGRLNELPFDFPEILGALAPRKVFVSAPIGDTNFRYKSVRRCVLAAKPVYDLFMAGGNLVLVNPNGGHDFPPEIRSKAYETIDSVLKLGARSTSSNVSEAGPRDQTPGEPK